MRKRRKTRYTWLPMLGGAGDPNVDESNRVAFPFQATTGGVPMVTGSTGSISLVPLLEDTPQESITTANPDPNIADFIGTDYVIKRLVGKIFLSMAQPAADTPFATYVTCGVFVARADDQQPLLPVGASTQALAKENYDPGYTDNVREPWAWRRNWVLGNKNTTNAGTAFGSMRQMPDNNTQFPGVLDGPHIDMKVARRVRSDERLWFVCSASAIADDNQLPTVALTVDGYADLRALGALRKAHNRSAF